MKHSENKIFELALVKGVEGDSVYLNDYRICGNKPWGGGAVKQRWKVSLDDICSALDLPKPAKKQTNG